MKLLIYLLLCATIWIRDVKGWRKFHIGQKVGGLPPPKGPTLAENEVQEKRFYQHVQNFNLLVNRFWPQRYFVNDEFFNANSKKVFLIIGGAQLAHKEWMKYGPWAEAAKEHGAMLFMLEHRYYGESPTDETNLRFETNEQALEDLARFITGMNQEYNLASDVKWYAFGGSYAGSLAVWLRARYPHLLAGAVAVSAPLQPVIDNSGYLEVVVNNLAGHSQSCVNNLKTAFEQLDKLIKDHDTNKIDYLFDLCDSFENSFNYSKDISNLYHILSEEFGTVAQFQNVGDIIDIKTNDFCDILVDENLGNEIERLALVNSLFLKKTDQTCLDYKYDEMIADYRNTTVAETRNMRRWFHHTCHDLGWYATSNQTTQVFGNKFPASFFIQMCMDIYAMSENTMNTGVRFTYNKFGGRDVQVSNVLFVHGSLDPWNPLGITETPDNSNRVIVVEGTGHCAALYSESENDSHELHQAKLEMFNTLRAMVNGEPLNAPTLISADKTLCALTIVLIFALTALIVICVVLSIKLRRSNKRTQRNSMSSKTSILPEKTSGK